MLAFHLAMNVRKQQILKPIKAMSDRPLLAVL